MTIEIREQGSKAFFKEVVCVLTQHRRLLKHPEAKLRDTWRMLWLYLVLCVGMLLLSGGMALAWGPDALTWVALTLLTVALVLNAGYLVTFHRLLRGLMERSGPATLTVDENGVELDRPGVQRVRMDWSTVAFLRVFRESLCVLPTQTGGVCIAVSALYAPAVMEALKECGATVKVY